MKLLSLSLDGSIFDDASLLEKKTIEYANMVDAYYIIAPYKINTKKVISEKLTVYGVTSSNKLFLYFKIWALTIKVCQRKKCELISTQDPFEFGLIAYFMKLFYDLKWHCQEHGDFFSQKYWKEEKGLNAFRYYLGKFLIKRADSIRVVSKRNKEYLVNNLRINSEKIINVPVYTEIPDINFAHELGVKSEFVFLNMGRFVAQKNIFLLLEAFRELKKQVENVKLVLIGKGELEEVIQNKIIDLGILENVTIKDWTDDIWQEYAQADAYVLSSNYEGWGRVVVEAVIARLPVVMTDVGCANELIKNEKSGLVVPVQDKDELVRAMLWLIKDSSLRRKLVDCASEELKKLPNKQETLDLYKKSWKKALNE
ncbi:hypothetical protein C0583_03335 [Candidatus Parcubacteria bacterium]|nr:MAG: hypothetical protein C0583_03335 [Candidatus Parcubacteria bacterium]